MYFQQAHLATGVDQLDLEVKNLPLEGQQIDVMHMIEHQGVVEHSEQLENGGRLTLKFGEEPVPSRRARMMREEEKSEDKFRFTL